MQELKKAIELALSGEWDQAHKIVQNTENRTAYWIHAVLHKIEGDVGNSKYWYCPRRRNGAFLHGARRGIAADPSGALTTT